MKNLTVKFRHLTLAISAAAAVMAFLALIISIIALAKSSRGRRVTAEEYAFGDDENIGSDTLAF